MKSLARIFYLSLGIVFAFSSLAMADVSLNVPFFSQKDGRWATKYIIDNQDDKQLEDIGCMMTCFSMALKYYGINTNPDIFNTWLKNHNGYNSSGNIDWVSKVEDYAEENSVIIADLEWEDLITGQNDQAIHNELIAGYPVIVKVKYWVKPTEWRAHWILVVEERDGQFYCWDPITPPNSDRVSINKYGSYLKYMTIRGPLFNKVLKFSDSSTVYLQSNNQLWPILNETSYILLGYRSDCVSYTSDWSYVNNLNADERNDYVVREELIPSTNNYISNSMIAYKIIEKVGPTTCVSMLIDETKIYLFGTDNKFHHILNEQVYYDLGYNQDWSDVVEISPDLFNYYGEGQEITGELLSIEPLPVFLGQCDEPDDPDPEPIIQYPIPQNLTATAINSSQISVSWDSDPDVLQYTIYFQGNGQDYNITVENNPRLFSGLEPNTTYTFKIQANYNNGNWSEISEPVQTTTLQFDGSNIVVLSMTTCKGLIDYKEAINPTNYFDNKDDDIYFIIKLENNYPYGALYLRFDLYYPNNELNKSFGRLGNYDFDSPNFTTCAQLNGEGNNLYHYYGIWTIKIFFGSTIYMINNYLTTYQFEIKDLPPEKVTGVTIIQIR